MTIEDDQLLIYGFKLPSLLVNLRFLYLSSWPYQHLHGDRGPGNGLYRRTQVLEIWWMIVLNCNVYVVASSETTTKNLSILIDSSWFEAYCLCLPFGKRSLTQHFQMQWKKTTIISLKSLMKPDDLIGLVYGKRKIGDVISMCWQHEFWVLLIGEENEQLLGCWSTFSGYLCLATYGIVVNLIGDSRHLKYPKTFQEWLCICCMLHMKSSKTLL